MDSLSGQWDYIEPVLFGYAAGMVIASYVDNFCNATDKIAAHFHEWMTAAGGLHLRKHAPYVATLFTTHATVMGRCIAGNGLPLYNDPGQVQCRRTGPAVQRRGQTLDREDGRHIPRRLPHGQRHHGQRMQIPAGA